MKTKWIDKTPQGDIEAVVSLTDQEVILIQDALGVYKGDHDDRNVIKIKEELNKGLHEAWKQLRPS